MNQGNYQSLTPTVISKQAALILDMCNQVRNAGEFLSAFEKGVEPSLSVYVDHIWNLDTSANTIRKVVSLHRELLVHLLLQGSIDKELAYSLLAVKRQIEKLNSSNYPNYDQLVQENIELTDKIARLRTENHKLRAEIFWLKADSAPYSWDDDSMPWGFSES